MIVIGEFKAKDIIATLAIVGFVILRLNGINGGFDAPIAMILGYYFVKRQNGQDNGK